MCLVSCQWRWPLLVSLLVSLVGCSWRASVCVSPHGLRPRAGAACTPAERKKEKKKRVGWARILSPAAGRLATRNAQHMSRLRRHPRGGASRTAAHTGQDRRGLVAFPLGSRARRAALVACLAGGAGLPTVALTSRASFCPRSARRAAD